MRSIRWSAALLLFGLSAPGCIELAPLQENTCGNGLVEPGEDCDGRTARDGTDCSEAVETCACRQAGEVDECRYSCETAADCPADGNGWGCGVDNVCRRPKPCVGARCTRWESATTIAESATEVFIRDFDGSGRGSVLSVSSPLVSVHGFDEAGRLLGSDSLVLPDASLAVGDLTSADPQNPDDQHPIASFAVDIARGASVFRGSQDAGVQPTVYASQTVPFVGKVQFFNYLDSSIRGPSTLFFPIDEDGKTSLIVSVEAGSGMPPSILAKLGPAQAGKIAGDPVVAQFYGNVFPTIPCEQVAVSFEGSKGVRVYSPCKLDGKPNIEGPSPSYIPPANISLPVGATVPKNQQSLFVVDADADQNPDLLILADDAVAGPSTFFLAFGRGDGTFNSTASKVGAPDGKAALYPVRMDFAASEQGRKHLHDAPLAVGDLNADCALDFVNDFGIYLSQIGKGSCFAPDVFFTFADVEELHEWTSAAIADFTADGLLDVMTGSKNVAGMTFYKGTANNVLNPFKLVTQGGVKTFTTGDFDGDFLLDLAFSQVGEADEQGVAQESLGVVYGGIVGGPSQPEIMGETKPIRQLLAGNVLAIIPDLVTDLIVIADSPTGKALDLSLFPGNSGRLLEAPYYLTEPKAGAAAFPSQFAIGQFAGAPHHDLAAFARGLCFTPLECEPQLWLIPMTGEAEILPAGVPGAPVPTPIPLVADGVPLAEIQRGMLLASVNLGPAMGASSGSDLDEVVMLSGGNPPLLYVATAIDGIWSISPKRALPELGESELRELGLTVADLDGENGPDVIVSSHKGVMVFWNQGTGALDPDPSHATFLSGADVKASPCDDPKSASGVIQAVASIAADADSPRELVVSTGHATYVVELVQGKLVPACERGLPGGVALAAGDVNGDGLEDLVIGGKGSLDLFLALPAPAGPDRTERP